jgi:glycerophosphoryl diester phosphodiesterase
LDLEWIGGKMIAHRGFHDRKKGIPENSLLAFEKAVEKRFPIELDIHLTKDGNVVVFHDSKTNRMCGTSGVIEEMTLDEIRSLKLLDTEQNIPTLDECLAFIDGRVPLLIEFKVENGNAKALCEKADQLLAEYCGPYLIQSFYPQVLFWYRTHRKSICRGQLASSFRKQGPAKALLGNMFLNFIGRPHFISYCHKFRKKTMFRFCVWQGGYPVGWTYESPDELRDGKSEFKSWIFENFTPDA